MYDFEKITALKQVLYKHSLLLELKEEYQALTFKTFKEIYSCINFNKKANLYKIVSSYTDMINIIDKKINNIQNEVIEIIK